MLEDWVEATGLIVANWKTFGRGGYSTSSTYNRRRNIGWTTFSCWLFWRVKDPLSLTLQPLAWVFVEVGRLKKAVKLRFCCHVLGRSVLFERFAVRPLTSNLSALCSVQEKVPLSPSTRKKQNKTCPDVCGPVDDREQLRSVRGGADWRLKAGT